MIAAREQQRERWSRLVRLSDAVAALKALFVTEIVKAAHPDSPLRKIVDFAEDFDENLQSTLMLDRPAGESETPDSARRREERKPRVLEAKPAFPGEGASDASEEGGSDE